MQALRARPLAFRSLLTSLALLLANQASNSAEGCSWNDLKCLSTFAQNKLASATSTLESTIDSAAVSLEDSLENALDCAPTNFSSCFTARSRDAASAMKSAGDDAAAAAQRAFLQSIGCEIADEACLRRRARELNHQIGAQATAIARGAEAHAAAAAQDSAERVVAALGCGQNATMDAEACLLRRAQEVGVVLSIAASTTTLVGAVGR